MDLLEHLQAEIVYGDGAMGTLLRNRGVPRDRCMEELCFIEPDQISSIHQEYIAAGARVIETNTFGANAVRLERFGLEDRVAEINKRAARIELKAAHGKNVWVAGSVGPLRISASEAVDRGIDRAQCFHEQMAALIEGRIGLIFLETFVSF
jgi:methionine synthase / methylenetetrahydrofolate reductase(NADPH)